MKDTKIKCNNDSEENIEKVYEPEMKIIMKSYYIDNDYKSGGDNEK